LILSGQRYYPGINDSLGSAFNRQAFSVFPAWASLNSALADPFTTSRERVAAGEQIFNTRTFSITNVRGLNDNVALGRPAVVVGTCTTCHDTPNVGNHSLPLPLDIGTSHAPNSPSATYEPDPNVASALAQLGVPRLPVYLISGCALPFSGQTVSFYTSDPGKALITGKCSDLNRGKGPILRGLAARAPYFHNGAASSLIELINFYDKRFNIGLSDDDKSALIAFLRSL
jgi:cytochrome c peroxidase